MPLNHQMRPNQWPEDGSLPQHVEDFVQWLVRPLWDRTPKSQADYGRANNVRPEQLSNWKRDPRVKKRIQELCDELNLSTERIQQVLNSVFRAATEGDMKAATLYLQHADRLAPRRVVIEDQRLSSMSDDELKAELAAAGMA